MNRLGEKSLKTLEYYEILEKLAAQAASEAAKEKCRSLRPLDDHEQAALWLRQTTDAKDLMVRQGSPSFGGIREVGAIFARVKYFESGAEIPSADNPDAQAAVYKKYYNTAAGRGDAEIFKKKTQKYLSPAAQGGK